MKIQKNKYGGRRLQPSEADTLRAISDFLDLEQKMGRCVYIRHNPISPIKKNGETAWRKVRASQLGAPDLIVFRMNLIDGLAPHTDMLCIEAKSSTGRLSEAQGRWAELITAQGARYFMVRSFEEFKEMYDLRWRVSL